MNSHALTQGAHLRSGKVEYRLWAPKRHEVTVVIEAAETGDARVLPMTRDMTGFCHAIDRHGRAGDLYKYRVDREGEFPDPASRWQPEDVHGPSMVIDPTNYSWRASGWARPRYRDLVIYELHVGTFTPEGTFLSAIDRLQHVRDLGANAIEIMPVADFPGGRNWGYDGVMLYAPAAAYGHPDDFRALIDAAHEVGLTVILDVVYNHFGPDGNYLGCYTDSFFNKKHLTPWGDGINFDGRESAPVRAFFVGNILYWMDEFRIDGFRLDATHAILDDSPKHILEEINEAISSRGGFAVAEDERNEARLCHPIREQGYGFCGAWSDDFHHAVRVALTGENESYFSDFNGTMEQLVETMQQGWLYDGRESKRLGEPRGTDGRHLAPERFVHCISNHDQVGNRPMGDRLAHTVEPAAYRAASALICLSPYMPMLFMGQEWAASTPFQFFTDHNPELGKLVTKGRRQEFRNFSAFSSPETQNKIPDPQAEQTFMDSKLRWDEIEQEGHAQTLALYQEFLRVRNAHPEFRPRTREGWSVKLTGSGVGALEIRGGRGWQVLFDLKGGGTAEVANEWEVALSSNEVRFGGDGAPAFDAGRVSFLHPEVLVLRRR